MSTQSLIHQDFQVPLFRLAFRPFFWFSAAFGAISIALWAMAYSGHLVFSPYGGSYFWHLHEMLFGFTAGVIVGFLLTAVQNWTGVTSVKGVPLVLLFLLWLCARVMMFFPDAFSVLSIAIIDVMFLPAAALAFARPIIKVRLWRNLFFIPILLTLSVLNGLTHLSLAGVVAISVSSMGYLTVLLISLIMCVMGGRVFPMFTANGTGTERVVPIAILEKLSIGAVLVSVIATLEFLKVPAVVLGLIYCFTGAINLIRALRWRIWVTGSTPLVWSLHLSYWFVCLGYGLLGLNQFQLLASASTALHAITVGGIGFMILSMISRVSLGHTGRRIAVGYTMTIALVLMLLSVVSRVALPFLLSDYALAIQLSAALWVMAFGLFVVRYAPVVFRARVDGRPG